MGTRPIRERTLAGILAGAFLFVSWVDASGLHLCPHHDRLPASLSDAEHGAYYQGASADDHADEGVHTEPPPTEGHGSHDEGPCTCLGDCQSTSHDVQVAASGVDPAVPVPDVIHASAVQFESADYASPQYRLPFANGPPHLI